MHLIALKDKDERFEKKDILILGIFAIIVLAIFAPPLQDFRFDTSIVFRIYTSSYDLTDLILDDVDYSHPPLMFVIYNIYLSIVDGLDPLLLSLPTFFFFITAAMSLFYVTMKMFGLIPAMMASSVFILLSSAGEYVYGIENMYMFVTFAILTTYLFYKVFVHGRREMMWFLVASNILMLWSHYASLVLLVAQLSIMLLSYRREFLDRANLKYFLVMLLFLSPLILHNIPPKDIADLDESPARSIALSSFFSGFSHRLFAVNMINIFDEPILLFSSSVMFLGLLYSLIRSRREMRFNVIVVVMSLYFAVILSYLVIFGGYYHARYHLSYLWIFIISASASQIILYRALRLLLPGKVAIFSLLALLVGMLVVFSPEAFQRPSSDTTYEELISDFRSSDIDVIMSTYIPDRHLFFYHLSDTQDELIGFYRNDLCYVLDAHICDYSLPHMLHGGRRHLVVATPDLLDNFSPEMVSGFFKVANMWRPDLDISSVMVFRSYQEMTDENQEFLESHCEIYRDYYSGASFICDFEAMTR